MLPAKGKLAVNAESLSWTYHSVPMDCLPPLPFLPTIQGHVRENTEHHQHVSVLQFKSIILSIMFRILPKVMCELGPADLSTSAHVRLPQGLCMVSFASCWSSLNVTSSERPSQEASSGVVFPLITHPLILCIFTFCHSLVCPPPTSNPSRPGPCPFLLSWKLYTKLGSK